ncbi:MAG TPA: aminodeoxychorismate synthase component I [Sphingobium sp.]|uniref:aminodeoxychorismate synthase component I n=1 Tax=Sphingobium sp. TaxID=1912891 RepID=UPI002ED5BA19
MPRALPPSPEPFLLLDDARPEGVGARLYRDPVGEVVARTPEEVRPALEALRDAGRRGLHVAGYMRYEAGYALEPALAKLATTTRADEAPLLWFGLFPDCTTRLDRADVPALLPAPEREGHGTARPLLDAASHGEALDHVLSRIRAGDIYQANLTMAAQVPLTVDPLAAYAAIRPRAAMGHGALIRQGGRHILCFSPESFFAVTDGLVETRPMKGTAPRHADPAEDARAAADLRSDPKQRAENLMIVDLIRNDLSRVCRPGTVRVPDLFTVESYPTVHQMTSRVTGRLSAGLDAIDALAALFPCGSVTGAPKIQAMKIIADIERHRRGVYTGSIGSIDPDGNARFNVAIRTISLEKDSACGVMGIGSGIVADSRAGAEWNECLDKARFLERPDE